jgi:hypothetical protein
VANEAALATVGRLLPNCLILSDEKNHASRCAGRSVSRRPLARIPAIIAPARRRSVPKIVLSHCASQRSRLCARCGNSRSLRSR